MELPRDQLRSRDPRLRGFGVRVEDAVWLNPETLKFEVLAKYPYDLVLRVKEAGRRK